MDSDALTLRGGPDTPTFPEPDCVERYHGRELDTVAIMELLPHRPPFLLVDKIVELEPGRRAVGVKNVTINEPFFAGHFPGHPVMPGVLQIEALAQVAGVIVLSAMQAGEKVAYFTGIKEAKFRRPVRPGDNLRLHVDLEKVNFRFGQLVSRVKGRAEVDGEITAESVCQFILTDPQT